MHDFGFGDGLGHDPFGGGMQNPYGASGMHDNPWGHSMPHYQAHHHGLGSGDGFGSDGFDPGMHPDPLGSSSMHSPWWHDAMPHNAQGFGVFGDFLDEHGRDPKTSKGYSGAKPNHRRASGNPFEDMMHHHARPGTGHKSYQHGPFFGGASEGRDPLREAMDEVLKRARERSKAYATEAPKPFSSTSREIRVVSDMAPNAEGVFIEVTPPARRPLDFGRSSTEPVIYEETKPGYFEAQVTRRPERSSGPSANASAGYGGGSELPRTTPPFSGGSPEPHPPLPGDFAEHVGASRKAAQAAEELSGMSRNAKMAVIGGTAALAVAAAGYAAHRLNQKLEAEKASPKRA